MENHRKVPEDPCKLLDKRIGAINILAIQCRSQTKNNVGIEFQNLPTRGAKGYKFGRTTANMCEIKKPGEGVTTI